MKPLSHMRNHLFAFALVAVLFPSVASGQDVAPLKARAEKPFRPVWVIKFAPLAMIDIDPTVQGAAEYFFRPRVSVQQEIGFMRIANWINIDEKYPRNIFRSRTEIRLYLSNRKVAPWGAYLALEGFYKHLSQPREGEINRGSYRQIANYRYIKNVAGGHLKLGAQTNIGDSDRWLFDAYMGLGLRSIKLKAVGEDFLIENLPDSPLDLLNIEDGRSHYTMPSVAFGFRLGYVIGAGKDK